MNPDGSRIASLIRLIAYLISLIASLIWLMSP